jgi:hypothetical protein
MRALWKLENAVFTVWTASDIACASSAHAEGDADADDVASAAASDPVGVGDAECVGDALGLADGLAEPDGLALAWVRVIVVTPFADDTVAVTSAPVVPMRRIPARAPAFAWNRSSSRCWNTEIDTSY